MTTAPTTLLFNLFKYSIYCTLALNVWLFFQEEWQAVHVTYADGIGIGQIITGFAATIDTASWVLLLAMFELETYTLSDKFLRKKSVEVTFWVLGAICYLFILYSFYGYLSKALGFGPLVAVGSINPCDWAAQGWSIVEALDQYPALNNDNCAELIRGETYFQLGDKPILGTADQWADLRILVWLDVINSFTWLALVALLEADVWFKLEETTSRRYARFSRVAKLVIYSILFGCAAYWGIYGDFLDFWDAFVWLLAFFFIELNMFQWNAKIDAPEPSTP